MSALIYLLEDDADIANLFVRELQIEGFEVRAFGRMAEFSRVLAETPPQLAIIDLSLPDGDGIELIADTLAEAGCAVIVVTGRGDLSDKLRALEDGADDYLVKPIDPLELAARSRAVLRRGATAAQTKHASASDASSAAIAKFAGWRADFDAYRLIAPDGAEEEMTHAEATLLRAFVDAPGRVLTRSILLDICAPLGDESFDRMIDVRVSRLRKKLRDDPRKPTHLKTVYGAGYIFASPVVWGKG